jgi:hypothetical protein
MGERGAAGARGIPPSCAATRVLIEERHRSIMAAYDVAERFKERR